MRSRTPGPCRSRRRRACAVEDAAQRRFDALLSAHPARRIASAAAGGSATSDGAPPPTRAPSTSAGTPSSVASTADLPTAPGAAAPIGSSGSRRSRSTSSCWPPNGARPPARLAQQPAPRRARPGARRLRHDRQDLQGPHRRDARLADGAAARPRALARGVDGSREPSLVVEVAFDGVQRSPRYPGGVALRFAASSATGPTRAPTKPTPSTPSAASCPPALRADCGMQGLRATRERALDTGRYSGAPGHPDPPLRLAGERAHRPRVIEQAQARNGFSTWHDRRSLVTLER